jgi:DNA-binding transcriptional ArsR family regulator
VIEWEVRLEDLARLRFAISPLGETVHSLRVLANPALYPVHLPWARAVRPRLGGLDLDLLRAMVPPRGYLPDFLTPPPSAPLGAFATEFDRVLATSPEQVAEELGWVGSTFPDPEHRAVRGRLAAQPAATLSRLGEALPAYWAAAIEPHWQRISDLLESDILVRAQALASAGAERLFSDLHEQVSWHGDRLRIENSVDFRGPLDGRGLVLLPSVFSWPRVLPMYPPYQPALSYPPRGVAALWEARTAIAPDALAALIGRHRAALLTVLATPASTTDLARRYEITPGAVSQHLSVLRRCGLVTSHRVGRRVLYRRTPAADTLLTAITLSSS